MNYLQKYLKYKSKYLQLKQITWWNLVINEAKRLQKIALTMDNNHHDFFISGSNAVVIFINELLTVDKHLLNEDNKVKLMDLIQKMQKPDDLDFKYKDVHMPLFHAEVEKVIDANQPKLIQQVKPLSLMLSLDSINENIDNCPQYIDIDAFRACLTGIGLDAIFEKRKDADSIFSKIDFDRYRRRVFKITTISDIKIMGLDDLIQIYEDNKGPNDEIKIEALKFIKSCIEKNNEILAKYIGKTV